MSNILKWMAVAVVLLFSSTALCGDPDWPEPPGVVELGVQVS